VTVRVALLDSPLMDRTMERWKRAAIVFALLLTGIVAVALYAQFEQLILHPFAFIGSLFLAALMGLIILRVALVPSQRYTGWVRSLGGRNGRWFFLILIVLWGAGMALLASLNLGPQQTGAPAFLGLFIGIFLFMGFIWSVIGE
jgi:hypothetical protein